MKIEKCYIINPSYATKRWQQMQQIIKTLPIPCERVEGINGQELCQKPYLNEMFKNGTLSIQATAFKRSHHIVANEIACFLSHFKAWQHMLDEHINGALFLEDHVEQLSGISTSIDIEHICYVNERFYVTEGRLSGIGASAYILSKQGAQTLVNNMLPIQCPLDLQLRMYSNNELSKYRKEPAKELLKWSKGPNWFRRKPSEKSLINYDFETPSLENEKIDAPLIARMAFEDKLK